MNKIKLNAGILSLVVAVAALCPAAAQDAGMTPIAAPAQPDAVPLDTGPLAQRSPIVKGFAYLISLVLPYLETFDLQKKTVYAPIVLANTSFAFESNAVSLADIWGYTGIALLYAIAYAGFALAVGMWLFQTRELGGAEG